MMDLNEPLVERPDWKAIVNIIPAGTRVLDLGCGDGQLLSLLLSQKDAHGKGVEQDEQKVQNCLSQGLSVKRGNIAEGLPDYADRTFEFVILNQVLDNPQLPLPVLNEMLRVARFGIVSFQKSGYWRTRYEAIKEWRRKRSSSSGVPFVKAINSVQFKAAVSRLGYYVDRTIFLKGSRQVYFLPALRAQTAIFVIGGHGTHA